MNNLKKDYMSNKQKITLSLEQDVYLKVKTSNINASEMANSFFKRYFNIEREEEETLRVELEEVNKQKILLEYELEKKTAQRVKEEQKTLTEEQERYKDLVNKIPRGEDFNSKLAREKYLKEHPEVTE